MSEALEERGRIVIWLLSEAFGRRFTPEVAAVYSRAATAIGAGRHYSDIGREAEDPLSAITRTAQADLLLEQADAVSELADTVSELADTCRKMARSLREPAR